MHHFLHNADLFPAFFAGIRVIDVDDGSRIVKFHFPVHFAEADQVFVVIVLGAVAVFADRAPQNDMRKGISCGLHLIAAVDKMVRVLGGVDGIEHHGKIAAGGIFHAGGHVKAADGQTVMLILHRAGADGHIGEKIFHISPVFRVEHLVRAGQMAFCDRADMHSAHGDQSLDHIRRFFRVRLGGDAFVPLPCGAGFVGVDAWDQDQPVCHTLLNCSQTTDIVTDSVLIVCGTGADNDEETAVISGDNPADSLIALFF